MKKTIVLIWFSLLLISPLFLNAQSKLNLDSLVIKQLKQAGDSILRGSNDSVRFSFNAKFYSVLDSVLQNSNSFSFSFDSIKTLAVLRSSDKKLRIYNWILPLQRGNEFRYFGFIQVYNKKTKLVQTIALSEKKWPNDSAEMMKLVTDNWYGALYYKLLYHKYKKKEYYTLLGWQGKDLQSTRKVIDIITFNKEKIQFGSPVFKTGGKAKTRVVFEYNAQATMSLKYDEKEEWIVYDHLSPSDPRPEAKNMFSLYGPDMSYDALKFDKGFWVIQKNVQPRNTKEDKPKNVQLEKKFRVTKRQ